MTLAMALIGAQLVSPSTRMPSSMRMMGGKTETKASRMGEPKRERDAQAGERAGGERGDAALGAEPQRFGVGGEEIEVDGLGDSVEGLPREREEGGDGAADAERRDARAGLPGAFVEDEQRLARRGAVGEGEVLLIDVVLAQWDSEQHAQQAAGREPGEDLQAGEVEVQEAARVQHVDGGENHRHEADAGAGGGPGGPDA